jgi:hypothetical protein
VRYGRLSLKTLAFAGPENQPPRRVQVRLNDRDLEASLQVTGSRALVTLAQMTIVKTDETLEVTLI